MSKALRTVGVVLGAVALIATGVGAIAGGAILGASFTAIGTYASLAAGVAQIGAGLTQKRPPARGSVAQVQIATDAAQPYAMGEGLFAGMLRHQAGYGATLKKVPNPYWGEVIVYSGGGPIEEITRKRLDTYAPSGELVQRRQHRVVRTEQEGVLVTVAKSAQDGLGVPLDRSEGPRPVNERDQRSPGSAFNGPRPIRRPRRPATASKPALAQTPRKRFAGVGRVLRA